MKLDYLLTALAVLRATTALEVGHQQHPLTSPSDSEYAVEQDADADLRLVELEKGRREWVTEEQKLEMKRNHLNFFDVTDTPEFGIARYSATISKPAVKFPHEPSHQKALEPLLETLSKSNMRENLEKFSSFHTRYYKSSWGIQSAEWLFGRINATIHEAGADQYGAHVKKFPHSWGQPSLIATIPGKSEKTIVIGAHQDSINMFLPSVFSAPGADDDGSGTVTILEALRVLLKSKDVVKGKSENTIEFHWYSAEEGGLLGSQALFSSYEKEGRDVKAMLQQDMTGYTKGTIDAGKEVSVGVITDFVDRGLTEFIKKVVTEYCDIPYILTKCGYACSDHASASKAGYPSAFVIESEFKYSDNRIHTSNDKIEYLDFNHMLQHGRLTLGLVYELAFAKFD